MPVYSVAPLRPVEFLQLNLAHLLVTGSTMPVAGPQVKIAYTERLFLTLLGQNAERALKVLAWSRANATTSATISYCLHLLAVLCRRKSPYVAWAFHQLVLTVPDLLEFLSICIRLRRSKRPWKNAKELTAHWLELNLTDKDVAIYSKKRSDEVSLKDAVLLTHPIGLSKQKVDFLFKSLTKDEVSGVYKQRLSLKFGNLHTGLPWEIVGPATRYHVEAFKSSLQASEINLALILMPIGLTPFDAFLDRLKQDPLLDPLTLFRACGAFSRASYELKCAMEEIHAARFKPSNQNQTLILLDRSGFAGTVFLQESYAVLKAFAGDIFLYDDAVEPYDGKMLLRARGGWYPTEAIAKTKSSARLVIMTARVELPDSAFEMLDLHYPETPVVIVYPSNTVLKKKYSQLRRAILGVEFLWTYKPFFQDPYWVIQEIEKWSPSYT